MQVYILGWRSLAANFFGWIMNNNNHFCSQRLPTQNANLTFYCQVCILGRRPFAAKNIIYHKICKKYYLLLFIQSCLQPKGADPNSNLTIKCQVCILGRRPLAAKIIIIIIIHYSSNNFCSQRLPIKNANLTIYFQVGI